MEQSRSTECLITRYEDAYGNWTYNTCTTKDSDEGQPWWAAFCFVSIFQGFAHSRCAVFFLNWFFKILSWPGVPLRLTRMAMWWIMPGETVLMAVLAHVSIFVKIWETRPKLAYSWQDLGWDHIGPLGPGFSSGRYILGFLNISLHASIAQIGLDIVDQMCVHLRMGLRGFMGFYVLGWVNFGRQYFFGNIMDLNEWIFLVLPPHGIGPLSLWREISLWKATYPQLFRHWRGVPTGVLDV